MYLTCKKMATLLIWTFIYTLLMPNKFNNQHLSSKDVKRVQFQTPNANDIRLIKTSNKMVIPLLNIS